MLLSQHCVLIGHEFSLYGYDMMAGARGRDRRKLAVRTDPLIVWYGGSVDCVLWFTANQGRQEYSERVSEYLPDALEWWTATSAGFNQHHLLINVFEMIFSHVALDCIENVIPIVDTNLELNQRVQGYIFNPYRELDQTWCIISSKSHPIKP